MSRPDTPDRARRYGQCDDTCTVDCGHCKGAGRPEPVSSAVDGQAVETPTISDRGFKHFDPITAWPDGYRGQVRVYESSAASHPCIWIAVEGNEHVHLTVEDAERLRDQIGYLIEHHYQLDSLPVVPPSARVDGETDGVARQLAALSDWIDTAPANAARDREAATWGRLAKITEEAGEVIAAFIGATEQNPRKGRTHDGTDVIKELLDVALTALCAVEHMTGNCGTSMDQFAAHVRRVSERAGLKDHQRGCQAAQGICLPCNCDSPGTVAGVVGDAPCVTCGRDNRNGTHAALEMVGHLSHGYEPEPVR